MREEGTGQLSTGEMDEGEVQAIRGDRTGFSCGGIWGGTRAGEFRPDDRGAASVSRVDAGTEAGAVFGVKKRRFTRPLWVQVVLCARSGGDASGMTTG